MFHTILNSLQKVRQETQRGAHRLTERLANTTLLERIGLLAMFILIMNTLFSVDVTITRQPLLNTLLGSSKQVAATLPAPTSRSTDAPAVRQNAAIDAALEEKVLPRVGVTLPVKWSDLGIELVKSGVVDMPKMAELYAGRGGMSTTMQSLLTTNTAESVIINQQNASDLLNIFWALGLGNKNDILEKGEMSDPRYGGAAGFASTGGWTLATGDAMAHFSKHRFITLTPAQQATVERVSKNIYRPCCGNATHFPDCNHGMAMLGLLELMASQGVNEADMYRAALAVNSYWFPDTYLTIATYFQGQGLDWNQVNPEQVLGAEYSSATGYRQVVSQVTPVQRPQSGGGCGV